MTARKIKQQPSPLKVHQGFWLRFVSNHVSIRFRQLADGRARAQAMKDLVTHHQLKEFPTA